MLRVLIVEDDSTMILLIKGACALSRGMETATILVGSDPMPVEYPWHTVDVAVVDQILGSYRGSELLGFLKAAHPSIRRVMFTGDTSITKEFANADAVLHKPADPSQLIAAIRGDKGDEK